MASGAVLHAIARGVGARHSFVDSDSDEDESLSAKRQRRQPARAPSALLPAAPMPSSSSAGPALLGRISFDSLRLVVAFLPPVPDRMRADHVSRALHCAVRAPPLYACSSISFASCQARLPAEHIFAALARWAPVVPQPDLTSYSSCSSSSSSSSSSATPASSSSSSLASLNLNSCFSLTNKLVPHLAPYLGAVRELTLTGCAQLGDAGMRLLLEATAPRLRVLNAAHCTGLRLPFSTLVNSRGHHRQSSSSSSIGGGSDSNRAFACLETADFSHCTILEVAQLIDLVQGSSALTSLDLSGVGAPVSSLIFAKLAQCARLRSLCMRRCTVVATRIGRQHGVVVEGDADNANLDGDSDDGPPDSTDASGVHSVRLGEIACVNHLLRGARALEVLDIAGCRPSSAALSDLTAGSRSLRSLNANRTSGVLRRIGGRYPALQELHIAWCATLDDESVRAVALSATRLRVLDASGTRITEETRRAIEHRFGSNRGTDDNDHRSSGGIHGPLDEGCGTGGGVQMFLASCRSIPREMRTLAAPGALCDPEPAAPSDDDD